MIPIIFIMLFKPVLGACCNGVEYDSSTEECCNGQVVAKGRCCKNDLLPEGQDCCTKVSPNQPYIPSTQCCDSKGIFSKTPISGLSNCPNKTAKPGYVPRDHVNGCGSANSRWVPQSFAWMVDFTGSCNTHDACYGTCNSIKASCDTTLGSNMASDCATQIPWYALDLFPTCVADSAAYALAVLALGGSSYDLAQKEGCICCP